MTESPSYHDLYVTTAKISRRRLSALPLGLEVSCDRVRGWCLYDTSGNAARLSAGEYDDEWLVLDVRGHVIIDSRSGVDEA